jgi:hypothetical protein
MNTALKQTTKFTLILLVTANSIAFAQNKLIRETPKEVQLGCDTPIINSYDLICTLTQAIQKDKTSASFRITWGGRLGGGTNDGTCLYNRKKGTLRYYDLTGYLYDVGWRPQKKCIAPSTKSQMKNCANSHSFRPL